jgi:exodeoxyribonuclease-3
MRITTFNINSIRARQHRFGAWLADRQPDVLCLQETKCQDHQFPHEVFERHGYGVEFFGQKSYNGVAIASRHPMERVVKGLPLADDPQARGIAVTTCGVRVANIYVVNGKALGTEHYDHKLRWLDGLCDWVAADSAPGDDFVLCGDFNIAPTDEDTWDPAAWHGRILCSEPERDRLRRLLDWGLTDAFRHLYPDHWGRYAHTWWDYRANGFGRGAGMRIDHHLVTKSLLARVRDVEIDRAERKGFKPSDHAPVTLVLDD